MHTNIISELAGRIVNKVRDAKVDDVDLQLTVSCGVTLWSSENNSASGSELISQADTALYEAKKAGRNGYKLFKPK